MAECSFHPGNTLPGCFYCINKHVPYKRPRRNVTAEDLYQQLRSLRKAGTDLSRFAVAFVMEHDDGIATWDGKTMIEGDSIVLE